VSLRPGGGAAAAAAPRPFRDPSEASPSCGRESKFLSLGTTFYFATPHHSWERGTNENTNGLIRQYLPKRTSMAHVTQEHCDAIAAQLNSRPRKRLGYKTPEECYVQAG
jgi:IS30 family transposase